MAFWLNQLTWPQAEKQIERVPVALVPVGATEQHGPHLPIGTDVFLAEKLAAMVSENTGALVYPSVNFGYSWVWRDRVGTVSLEQPVLQKVLENIVQSVERYGIRLLVFVNGHEANSATLKYAVREIQDKTPVKVLGMFYPGWSKVYEDYMETPTWNGMFHACEFETSMMLAACEELVYMEQAVEEYPRRPLLYGMDNTSIGDLSKSGVYGNPKAATKEKGEKMLEIFARQITQIIIDCGYGQQ
ncbi:MAG: creatininase family protein [Lachnospiraceae bacterium]|uniref:creatininase family protein n=1 Tax=Candidatus Merdisoma sp. JLR.KK006 TaxID=3112626 RepID=UPI002FF02667|nr:creatininase family protein [Lachnospiraceae bacterium]